MNENFKIPHAHRKEILERAISLAKKVHVDELDVQKSILRQPTDKTVKEVLEIGLRHPRTHYHFILRPTEYNHCNNSIVEGYFDVGLSTAFLQTVDYFLWITLGEDDGWKMINEYSLKPRR